MLGSSAVWVPSTGSSPMIGFDSGTLLSPTENVGDTVLYTTPGSEGCLVGAFVSEKASRPLWIAEAGSFPSPGWIWRERLSDIQPEYSGEWIWARDMSCGCIPFRQNRGIWEVLLIQSAKKGEWGFPKGHREPHESEECTALRETMEETSTRVRVLPGVRTSFSIAPYPGARKEIVLFPALYDSGSVVLSPEHAAYAWLPIAEARARIPFENDRRCLDACAAHRALCE